MTGIPLEAMDQHVAILAKTGKGKTIAAKGAAAAIMRSGSRVGVIDPTAAWWGMRLNADGKTPAFPMAIFGGDHADIEISEGMGAKLGKLVAEAAFSWIIDTSKMGIDRRTEFFTDFAEAIFAANRRRIHLFMDECHLFMPQAKLPSRASAKMTQAANNLVSGGRSRGFCITMISQRSAKVHKDSLTQAETLITLGMIAPQDIKAAEAWVKVQGDIGVAKEMLASLPGLPRGEGWIYSPELGMLERVKFPMIDTFDSSRAPGIGEEIHAPTELGQIDIEGIRAALSITLPARSKSVSKNNLSHDAIAEIEEAAESRGRNKGLAEGERRGYAAGYAACLAAVQDVLSAVRTPEAAMEVASRPAPVALRTEPSNARVAGSNPAGRTKSADGGLPGPEQRIINSLGTWAKMGSERPNNAQVAWMAGYSPTSTSYTNPRGSLRSKGLLEYPSPDRLMLTGDGAGLAAANKINGPLLDFVLDQLPGPERRILAAIAERFPKAVSNDDAATAAGYSAISTSYTNPRGSLKSKELIAYPSAGFVKAADWLFER
ncbi:MAG: hypothetical protein ACLQUZ_15615 [Rhizomicrobium sp.]